MCSSDLFLGVVLLLLMLAMTNAAERPTGTELQLVTLPVGIMAVLVLAGNMLFAMPPTAGRRRPKHVILGFSHGVAHVLLGVLGTWLWLATPLPHLAFPLALVFAAVLYLPVSGLVACELVSLYLLVASSFHVNVNELFAGQSIMDSKGFLRLHFTADGGLTIYPVAVDKVSRKWTATPTAPPDRPWFEPVHPMPVHLAEPPIRVR